MGLALEKVLEEISSKTFVEIFKDSSMTFFSCSAGQQLERLPTLESCCLQSSLAHAQTGAASASRTQAQGWRSVLPSGGKRET